MRYWWVNQNQTHRHEIGNGFLWSPKRNADGSYSPYYNFMTEMQPGDIVFSYVNGYLVAVGVASSASYSSIKPREFGKVGEVWSQEGWKVDVDFQIADNPVSPKNHLKLIEPLLPEKYSPLTSTGSGNQAYLFSIPAQLGILLLQLLRIEELTWGVTSLDEIEFDEAEQEIIRDVTLEETMKQTLVLARRGQGKFRERVRNFERQCRVTGVSAEQLLIASHIKPWKSSSNEERLSGHNGLFLSPHIDKLFDSGLMSFENSGAILISPQLDSEVLRLWNIDPRQKVKKFGSDQNYFLEHHRNDVFRSA